MSIEAASLILDVDARDVRDASRDLDNFKASAKGAGSQAQSLRAESKSATDQLRELGRTGGGAMKPAEAAMRGVETATKAVASATTGATSAAREMAQAVLAQEAADRAAMVATSAHTNAVQQATAAARQYSHATQDLNAHMLAYRSQVAPVTPALAGVIGVQGRAAASSKLLGHEMLNLSRQFADIGVTAAMGMNPLMILIQQGPQIGETFAMAAARGITFTGVLKQVAAAAWAAIVPLLPYLLPLIAAVTAAAAGFGLLNRELSKSYPKDITDGMNLTEEQLKRVTARTVTMGDTFMSTLDVMGKHLMTGPLGAAIKWLGDRWSDLLDGMAKFAFEATARVIGFFIGAYRTIVNNWQNLPAALGSVIAMAVNKVIDGVQKMVNSTVDALNLIKRGAALFNPAMGFLPDIPQADLSKFKLSVSSAFEFVSKSAAANIAQATEEVRGGMRRIGAEIGAGALARARRRAADQAGAGNDANKGPASKTGKPEDDPALLPFQHQMDLMARAAQEWAAAVKNVPTVSEVLGFAESDAAHLDRVAESFDQLARHAEDSAGRLRSAFGGIGGAVGDLNAVFANFDADTADIAARQASEWLKYQKALVDLKDKPSELKQAELAYAHSKDMAAAESAQLQIAHYGDIAAAAKGFFKEGSSGYKALQAAEQAYRIFEFAMSVRSLFMKTAETAATVVGAGVEVAAVTGAEAAKTAVTVTGTAVRTPLKVAEGAASMFASLGPLGFVAVAAMLALMVGLGFKGGKGGGAAPTFKELQEQAGAGSVLGDSKAKSESLSRAMDIVARNTNKDLEYSNAMLKALRSIDASIGAVAASLARELGAGGVFDTSGLGLGKSGGPTLMTLGFGAQTKKTLADQGLQFSDANLADILSGGIKGSSYQSVATTKKAKAFGITVSSKTSTKTTSEDLDDELAKQITLLVGSLKDGVLSAATALGIDGAEATLAAFTVSLGKLSFKDMTGEEIEKQLEAVFGKLGDDLAKAVFGDIGKYQRVGEGAFETLARVARGYQVVDVSLSSLGKTFGMVGAASIEARERLIDLSGGLDQFTEQASFFADNFLTEQERLAPIQAAVTKEMARLGYASVDTRDEFKALVLGLDVSTEAGAALYAALMNIAPAFAKVTGETEALKEARDALSEAYERKADALQGTIDKLQSFADSLAKFRRTLTAGPAISAASNLQAVQANFRDIAARTKLGDVAAFEQFQDAAEAFRQTALENAPNARAYARTLAEIRNATEDAEDVATRHASIAEEQLDALKKLVEPLLQINKSVLSVRDAIMKLQGAMAGPGGIQGQVVALAAQGPTAGANDNFNAAAYLAANKDIGKAAAAAGVDAATFALQHYLKTGQFEIAGGYRSRGFATGGGFTVGGSSSTGDRVPVNFMANRGEHVNISREDNMAKVAAALERQNQLLAEQNATLAKIAKSTGNTDKILTFTTHGGEALRTVAA